MPTAPHPRRADEVSWASVAAVYRGVDPDNPVLAQGGSNAPGSATVTVPSLTPANIGDQL